MVYSLFLGFGIGAGSDMFELMDKHARKQGGRQTISVSGTVTTSAADSGINPFYGINGTFEFTNSSTNAAVTSLDLGNINCIREAADGWWARPAADIRWAILLVPLFAIFLCLANLQPLNRKMVRRSPAFY